MAFRAIDGTPHKHGKVEILAAGRRHGSGGNNIVMTGASRSISVELILRRIPYLLKSHKGEDKCQGRRVEIYNRNARDREV